MFKKILYFFLFILIAIVAGAAFMIYAIGGFHFG